MNEIYEGTCLALANAVADGRVDRLKQLAALAGTSDCRGYFGATPLYWAVAARTTSLPGIKALLETGADPNAYLEDGNAVIHIAAMRGDAEIMRLLLAAGGNPNLRGRGGQTPLFLLQPSGGHTVVPVLLSFGADPNATADNGGTAMMALAATRQFRAIDLLLQSGADWSIKTRSGDSLLSIIERIVPTWDTSSAEYPYFLKVKAALLARPRPNNSSKPTPLRGAA